MPRINQYKEKYMMEDFTKYVYGEMKFKKISGAKLGEILGGISQQAISYKMKNNVWTMSDLIRIFEAFSTPEEKILSFIRR